MNPPSSNSRVQQIYVAGAYGFNNAGDDAILISLLKLLRASFPQARIVVASFKPEVMPREDLAQFDNIEVVSNEWYHRVFCLKTLALIFKSDVYVQGGDTPFTDVISKHWVIFWAVRMALAKMLGKRVVVTSIEVGPVSGFGSKFCLRWLVNYCADLITVRNQESYQALRQLQVTRPKIKLTCDPAQLLDACPLSEVEQLLAEAQVPAGRPIIGFVVRTLGEYPMMADFKRKYFEPTWPNDGRTWNESIKIKMAWLADQVVERLQATPLFICYRYEAVGSNDQSHEYIGDNDVIKDICRYMRHPGACAINRRLSIPQIIGLTRRLDLLITMRLHAMILSSNVGTPVVALRLEDKIPAYLRALGQGNCLIETKPFNAEEAWKIVEQTFTRRETIREVIRSRAEDLRQRHQPAWEEVVSCMERRY